MKKLMVLALCLAWSVVVAAQPATPPEYGPFRVDSLEAWDKTVDILRKSLWEAEQATTDLKDSRGRTPSDYMSEVMLQPDTVKKLTELRERANTQSADAEALERTIAEAETILMTEVYKGAVIGVYWIAQDVVTYHGKILATWLPFADEADRQAIGLHLKATDDALGKMMTSALTVTDNEERRKAFDGIYQLRMRAASFYNERRLTFVKLALGKPGVPALLTRQRAGACGTPASKTSGGAKPAFAPGNEAPESLYPRFAKNANVEGPVDVQARISETGCMEYAEIAASSGDETLDDAALQWAERAQFLPAEKDGKPVTETFKFRVKFELKD